MTKKTKNDCASKEKFPSDETTITERKMTEATK